MTFVWAAAISFVVFFCVVRKKTRKTTINYSHLGTFMLAASAVIITVSMVLFPEEIFEASLHGLDVWWNIVFPALLPFFILSHILIGLGVVHMMGVVLEPLMRPVFNLPGIGAFVMAIGFSSGFPIGAVLTADMRRKNLVSKVEAERLISFVNTADPLFMFGAVAVGMFGYPEAGIKIAVAHYLSSISLGVVMRFYGYNTAPTKELSSRHKWIITRAINTLIKAREEDGRAFGQLMGDAVHKSINIQALIGGFIILSAVVVSILEIAGVVNALSAWLSPLLSLLGLDTALATPLINGFFEIDLGCKAVSSPGTFITLDQKIIAASIMIAWSGLSVHAQVASIISKTDISIRPYILARLIHGALAGFYAAIITGPAEPALRNIAIPVFLTIAPPETISFCWERSYFMLQQVSILILGIYFSACLFRKIIRPM